MKTLNDAGPDALHRVNQTINDMARAMGIDPKILIGYWNHTFHLPQNIGELEAFGHDTTNNPYGAARLDAGGGWHPIIPGVTPGKEGEMYPDGDWPGFNHMITNPEDSAVQLFGKVDDNGDIFGGSWDPAYNAAHPELAGRKAYDPQFNALTPTAPAPAAAPAAAPKPPAPGAVNPNPTPDFTHGLPGPAQSGTNALTRTGSPSSWTDALRIGLGSGGKPAPDDLGGLLSAFAPDAVTGAPEEENASGALGLDDLVRLLTPYFRR